MDKELSHEIIATSAGLVSFALFSMLGVPAVIGGLGGVGIYVGTKFLTAQQKQWLPPNYAKLLTQIQNEVSTLEKQKPNIKDTAIRARIEKVILLTKEIIERIQGNKNTLIDVHDFLMTCLAPTRMIVEKYVMLLSADYPYAKLTEASDKLENILNIVLQSLEKEYQKILDGDLLELDSEIEVLKRTIHT